jgi:hypothetical protein
VHMCRSVTLRQLCTDMELKKCIRVGLSLLGNYALTWSVHKCKSVTLRQIRAGGNNPIWSLKSAKL